MYLLCVFCICVSHITYKSVCLWFFGLTLKHMGDGDVVPYILGYLNSIYAMFSLIFFYSISFLFSLMICSIFYLFLVMLCYLFVFIYFSMILYWYSQWIRLLTFHLVFHGVLFIVMIVFSRCSMMYFGFFKVLMFHTMLYFAMVV
jgi:hypothetical protein